MSGEGKPPSDMTEAIPPYSPGASPGAKDRLIRRRVTVDGRVRSGCLTCKTRKKKCDGQISSVDNRCRACIRLGLVCEQSPLRKVAPRRRTLTTEVATTPENISNKQQETQSQARSDGKMGDSQDQTPPNYSEDSLNSIEPLLLKYFLSDVAPLCSILQQDGASFCSVLLPMAIVDSSLLHALFTYASVHFDATAPVSTAISPRTRLGFETHVARGISNAIARNTVTESTVACALVVSTAHVIGGDTSRWLLHLQGAGHLISHLGPPRLLKIPDGAFLLRYFAYHDIMAALSTGRHPSIEGVYWALNIDGDVHSADSFVGLAHHIFRHITSICAFVADTSDLDASSSCDRLANETLRAETIAHALRSQDLHLQLRYTDNYSEALVHHAEAFRFAALFHLYRRLLHICGPSAIYEQHMVECVQRIFSHVSLVPLNLYCEIGLLFPLFMAGIGGANDASAVHYIQNRLDYIETWTKFKHVTRTRELLQLLWDQKRTDWEVVLRELDWHISLA
ncbi:hypothetical protein BDBG_04826 [Blastomyces gilchristii SLH14081]|uniref:Zn(2)-C6 fungal-type domain-containing protein n=1 Tax=Blastomyces gilchristii (strain SLH14081) TaxID=559298 RepID=A0A179UL08_BLAGS|nr:uncharacterized protein BDBG_04826 [Blastomyces gilchristii SLH14081]OAT08560.1 hypothetical protein BDBG_04826 [Blastomyces gilchristii SLH14081]